MHAAWSHVVMSQIRILNLSGAILLPSSQLFVMGWNQLWNALVKINISWWLCSHADCILYQYSWYLSIGQFTAGDHHRGSLPTEKQTTERPPQKPTQLAPLFVGRIPVIVAEKFWYCVVHTSPISATLLVQFARKGHIVQELVAPQRKPLLTTSPLHCHQIYCQKLRTAGYMCTSPVCLHDLNQWWQVT